MKLTTCKMPPELIDRLNAESRRSGAPKSEIIRRAIDEYLRIRATTDVGASQESERADALAASVA